MAAVAIDSLEYAHQLEAVGMPREQAEVVAKGLTTMFVHNFDSLVTRDYLDTRFTEFETRLEAKMERRFVQVDNRSIEMETSIETRFVELETSIGTRFVELETSIETRFVELGTNMARLFSDFRLVMHGKIGDVRGDVGTLRSDLAVFHSTQKLHSWMFGLLITGTSTLILQNFFL